MRLSCQEQLLPGDTLQAKFDSARRGRLRRDRAARPRRRALRRPAAGAARGRPGRGGDAHRLPGDRPLHRRLRRRPAPRRGRAAALPAQRHRRARRRGGADPGQLGDVQPPAAAVHPAAAARRGPRGAAGGAGRAERSTPPGRASGSPSSRSTATRTTCSTGWTRRSTSPRRCERATGHGSVRVCRGPVPHEHRGGRPGQGDHRRRRPDRARARRRLQPAAAGHRAPRLRRRSSPRCTRSATTAGWRWSAGCAASRRPRWPRPPASCGPSSSRPPDADCVGGAHVCHLG